jgi:hypothetical protein
MGDAPRNALTSIGWEDGMGLNDRRESLESLEIERGPTRRRILEMLFQAVTDDELTKEWRRRKRQLGIGCICSCHNELAGLRQSQQTGSSIRQLLARAARSRAIELKQQFAKRARRARMDATCS